MPLVVLPLSVVDLATLLDQPATAISLARAPGAFVQLIVVDPDLNSLSIFESLVIPFSLVLDTFIFKDHPKLEAILIVCWGQLLALV